MKNVLWVVLILNKVLYPQIGTVYIDKTGNAFNASPQMVVDSCGIATIVWNAYQPFGEEKDFEAKATVFAQKFKKG
ncbi:MAG TPA: hypothetical protein PLY04_00855 [bacterium]|nr:hypothetical protein [bacterium]